MTSLHDGLLAALETVADVALVARLRDERLCFPDESRLNVFFPDVHLVTARRKYAFGTNHPQLLTAAVSAVRDFRIGAAPAQVVVYQLGDCIDLWRETGGLDPTADVASAIEDAHPDLMAALYDPDLDAQFVLGNHDRDLARWPNYDVWRRTFYLPSAVALHGDVLDEVEELPDGLQNLVVHWLAPGVTPSRAPIGALAPPAAIAGCPRFNVHDAASPPAMLRLFDAALAHRDTLRRESGLPLTTMMIGHTHHARIVLHDAPDDFFALVDCGAWIEDCVTLDDPTPRPNAQIAAAGADEIRIYQLRPRPPV
jgi:UDP-2,3-diacylglucosamine pyrophosphatase LpxH